MSDRYVPTARWVYDYYRDAAPAILDHTLNSHYSKWLEHSDSIQLRISWAHICGLVKVARDRKLFNEQTWEIITNDD